MATIMAVTPAITDNSSPTARLLTALVAAAVAASLLGMAVPRFVGSVLLLPGNSAAKAMAEAERAVSIDELKAIISSREAAARWLTAGSIHTVLGQADIALADQSATGDSGQSALVQDALDNLRAGLSAMPASGFGWAMLSFVRGRNLGYNAQSAAALENSMLFLPHAKDLSVWRLGLGLAQLAFLDDPGRRELREEARIAWQEDPNATRGIIELYQATSFLDAALAEERSPAARINDKQ
jgi:hypothetical protein